MATLNVEQKTIEDWLTSPDAYADSAKDALKERLLRQGDLTWQLARLEAEWLEISEAIEKLDAAGP